jgi:hypothetical protein
VIPAAAKLLRALREPAAMAGFLESDWDLVVRQAAAAGLLGRLAALSRQAGAEEALPVPVRRHMTAHRTIAEQQQRAVRWELVHLSRALEELPGPVLLLKGAAYAAADLPPAAGRLFSDIDLMVPKDQLGAAEAGLMFGGWHSSRHDAYDQRYYRQWMHELPPMVHIRRQTVIDLHHSILPETARIKTRPDLILAAAAPLPEYPRFSIPCRVDQVLHSATHLFHEGEWQHGLRDLVDLDALLRAYAVEPGFWDDLLQRADRLNLGRPLYYALRYAAMLLETPVPADVIVRCPSAPSAPSRALMDRLFPAAFATAHHTMRTPLSGLAEFVLHVRSHWLRMPAHLLLPHLVRKSWTRRTEGWFDRGNDGKKEAAGGAPIIRPDR